MPPSFFCAARALLRSQATLFLRAVRMWRDADGLRMSAAMSFYGMLSLAPLLLVLVGVLGWWIDKAYLETNLIDQVRGVMGERGAEVVRLALASAKALSENKMAPFTNLLSGMGMGR